MDGAVDWGIEMPVKAYEQGPVAHEELGEERQARQENEHQERPVAAPQGAEPAKLHAGLR
jgi:hypothetical protein